MAEEEFFYDSIENLNLLSDDENNNGVTQIFEQLNRINEQTRIPMYVSINKNTVITTEEQVIKKRPENHKKDNPDGSKTKLQKKNSFSTNNLSAHKKKSYADILNAKFSCLTNPAERIIDSSILDDSHENLLGSVKSLYLDTFDDLNSTQATNESASFAFDELNGLLINNELIQGGGDISNKGCKIIIERCVSITEKTSITEIRPKLKNYKPLQTPNVGGLGPDMHKIKPIMEMRKKRLEYGLKVSSMNLLKMNRKKRNASHPNLDKTSSYATDHNFCPNVPKRM